jgi:tRNA(fMet)-specific endonuclease VapC
MAVRIAVDTSRYRDFSEGLEEAVDRFRSADQIFLPFVVLAELRAGFLAGSTHPRRLGGAGSKNAKVLTAFLNRPRVRVLWADQDTTHLYARLWNQLRSQGTPIPTNDLWIAALVVQHDLLLFSRDTHFDRLPQLARV